MNTAQNTSLLSAPSLANIELAQPAKPLQSVEVTADKESTASVQERNDSGAEPVKPMALSEALEVINTALALERRSLSFKIDDDSGRNVIKVMDDTSSEVIRQIPSEEVLKVARDIKRLQEEMGQSIGLLIDSRV